MRLVLNHLSIHNLVNPFLILQFVSMGHKSCSKMHLIGSSIFLNFDPQRFYAKAKTSLSVCDSNCQEWHFCAKVVILPLFGALMWWEKYIFNSFCWNIFSTAFVSAFLAIMHKKKVTGQKSADFLVFPQSLHGAGDDKDLGFLPSNHP